MTAWLQRFVAPKIVQVHLLPAEPLALRVDGSVVAGALPPGPPAQKPPVVQCLIQREGESFRLRDVRGGRRGTLVNYRYVRDTVLVPGDHIEVGGVVYRFGRLPASRERAAGARAGGAIVRP